MANESFIQCRVSAETKAALRSIAAREGNTESQILKELVDMVVRSSGPRPSALGHERARVARDGRLTIRLAPDDRTLLRERATARGMASATYASVVIRSHLRRLAPLPEAELTALKRSVAELGIVGRALHQIARAAEQGARINGPDRDGFAAFLKIAESLRDHTKALVRGNIESWERGYADPES